MNRNPQSMANEEIVREINSLQDELRSKGAEITGLMVQLQDEVRTRAIRIQELSKILYQRVRRAPIDDSTAIYTTYSNVWTRFAGMLGQGLTRASSASRVLRRLPATRAEPAAPERPKPVPVSVGEAPTPVESLITMYDEIGADDPEPSEA